jgi:Zn-dependent protease with chaperone function
LGDLDETSGWLTFPFLAVSIAYTLTQLLVGLFLVGPLMAALWRRRRLLADATAVELTRNPDALAHALERTEERAAEVPPGPWTHLFLVGPEVRQGLARRRFDQRMAELRRESAQPGEGALALMRRRLRESSAAQREYQQALQEARGEVAGGAKSGGPGPGPDDGDSSSEGILRSSLDRFLPPLDTRLRRLEALGATLADRPDARLTRRRPRPTTAGGWVTRGLLWAGASVLVTVLLALLVVCGLMLLACLVALIYIALMFELLLVVVPVLLVNALVR